MSWPMVELGSVAVVNWGNTSITKKSYVDDGFKAYSAAGADGYLDDFEFDSEGVVLSAIGARCGKCFKAEGKWTAIKNTITITSIAEPKLDLDYFYYMSNQSDFWPSRGGAQPFISLKDARAKKIPLPPLETQKQIAAVLEKADQLRKDCLQMEQELNSLAQSVFIEMFGDVKEHEALEQHIEFITSGSRGWAKYYSNKGPRFIRSLDVQMNYIGDKDKAFVTPPEGKESERTKVEAGDVLLTITGSRIGRVSWIPPEFGDAHISQHVALIRLKDTLLPEFLSFYMSLDGFGQRQIAKSQYGQTKPGLKLDHIRAFFVPKLKRAEQQEFVNYMRKLASVTLHNKKQYQALNANFNALMQKAFNGELNLGNAKTQ